MIVVTGAAGFIGSALLGVLQARGYGDLVAVDDFAYPEKNKNLADKPKILLVEREDLWAWMEENGRWIQCVLHMGARTNTAEQSLETLNYLNVEYSQKMWKMCIKHSIPLIYASSAATYGSGQEGFSDEHALNTLKPLNLYGESKHKFDLWVQAQTDHPPFWAGFKFFNVFGPNEYHKGRMASVIMHAYSQINGTGKMRLFQSHVPEYKNGEQQRDFIYVKDLIDVLIYFMENRKHSGLYNLGTGKARTFNDLALAVFKALNIEPNIEYIPIPEDIREAYQYYTQADMQKLRKAGYKPEFTSLEEACSDYVERYLSREVYL
jgi:ADP-L-glycero-D-manno-heptose 6-epimerase